jgi:hypothetical protein
LLGAAFLSAPSAAIDLTGTWVAPKGLRCKIRSGSNPGFKESDGNVSTLLVTHTGEDLYVSVNPGGGAYENKFRGSAFTHPSRVSKGYGVATACTVEGKYYAGSLLVPKAQADADAGKLTVVFHGRRFSTMAECRGSYERTSAVDPTVVQSCP